MLITECTRCGGEVEYLSEMHLIPKTDPPEAGFEGVCLDCNATYYHKFRQYETEISNLDYPEENQQKEVIKL
jgi:hypothetical protein